MTKKISRKTIMKIRRSTIGVETIEDKNKKAFRFFVETEKNDNIDVSAPTVTSIPIDSSICNENSTIKDCLILIVKADGASSLIDRLLKTHYLQIGDEGDLFINTMKMWNGTSKDFENSNLVKEFYREDCSDSFAKEYDYYVLRFKLLINYSGTQRNSDSYERSCFFKQICEDRVELLTISKRLSFDDNNQNEAFSIYN